MEQWGRKYMKFSPQRFAAITPPPRKTASSRFSKTKAFKWKLFFKLNSRFQTFAARTFLEVERPIIATQDSSSGGTPGKVPLIQNWNIFRKWFFSPAASATPLVLGLEWPPLADPYLAGAYQHEAWKPSKLNKRQFGERVIDILKPKIILCVHPYSVANHQYLILPFCHSHIDLVSPDPWIQTIFSFPRDPPLL